MDCWCWRNSETGTGGQGAVFSEGIATERLHFRSLWSQETYAHLFTPQVQVPSTTSLQNFFMFYFVSDLLSQVEGGSELWANKDKLSELRWKREILKVICGKSPPCEQLRGLVLRYYRGTSDLSLQKWSGVDHHLTKVFVRSYVLFLLTFVYISGTVRHST